MSIAENLISITQKINATLKDCGRPRESVRLVAVSKHQPLEKLKIAISCGQKDFAENYLQEALSKIEILGKELNWHFIGAIQANKTREIAENFTWVHTISRIKIAKRLSEARPEILPPLNICVQVNIDREPSKAGIMPEELEDFFAELINYKQLKPRGLMVIPKARHDYQEQLQVFLQVKMLFQQLQSNYSNLDTLSMGMSDDFVAAIVAGSTMVRVGTAIFGLR